MKKREISMKVTGIILSAGKGKRMNSNISKQYLMLNGKPLIYYTIKSFENSNIDDIIIVTGTGDEDYIKNEIVERYNFQKVSKIATGGKERYNSSYNGILAAQGSDYVLIHDAARPCISSSLINEIIRDVKQYKACVPGVPVKDTIKIADENGDVADTPDRNKLWQIQTPQAFDRELILEAYNKMIEKEDYLVTDDSMVFEKYSDIKVRIVNGEYTNIKATTPEDMRIVEEMIKKTEKNEKKC